MDEPQQRKMNLHNRRALAGPLAGAMLAGELDLDAICERVAEALGGWARPLSKRVLAGYASEVRPARHGAGAGAAAEACWRRGESEGQRRAG
jgi:hypothetical protein